MDTEPTDDAAARLDDDEIERILGELDDISNAQVTESQRAEVERLRAWFTEHRATLAALETERAAFDAERAAHTAAMVARWSELGIDGERYVAATEEERSEMLLAVYRRTAVDSLRGLLGRERTRHIRQAIIAQAQAINSFRAARVSQPLAHQIFKFFDALGWEHDVDLPPCGSVDAWIKLLAQHVAGGSAPELAREREERNRKYRALASSVGPEGAKTVILTWDELMRDVVKELLSDDGDGPRADLPDHA